jgi:hypothetical protein
MTGVTTPVVGAFLCLALGAMAAAGLARSARRVAPVITTAAVVLAGTAALPVLFPGAGYFPFQVGDLVAVLAVCALLTAPALAAPAAVRVGAGLYGAVSLGLFFWATQMGGNDARLAAYIGVPLVMGYGAHWAGRRPRPRRHRGGGLGAPKAAVAVVVACLVVWQWAPMAEALGGADNGRSSAPPFYQPLIDELGRLSAGGPVRIEVPPLDHHWESAYLAPKFPLARGWERQLDMAYDPIFYPGGGLGPSSYRSWLLANGVSYVALANAPLDYAAVAEAALLRSGTVPGLEPVWRTAGWQLWAVQGSAGLATGPAQVDALAARSVLVRFSQPGASVVKLRWTPYWSLTGPERGTACLGRAPGGWTELRTADAGQIQLRLSVLGAVHGRCTHQ